MVEIAVIVNILAFLGLTIATYTIFYLGRMLEPEKGISVNLFTLALGINLIGLSYLFRTWLDVSTSPLILVMVAIGSIFLSTGVVWVLYEKSTEIKRLKRQKMNITDVINEMKAKYYSGEMSEEDLKGVYSNLMRELAEIEVKLKKRK